MTARFDLPARIAVSAAAALVLAAVGAMGVVGAEAQTRADVLVEDFVFQPDAVTVAAGGIVTWTLGSDPDQHTVTPRDPGQFEDSGQLFEGDTYAVTFEEPGSVDYYCRLHPTMTGTVTVVAAPGPTATEAATASPVAALSPTPAVLPPSPAASPTVLLPAPSPAPDDAGASLLPLAVAGAFAVAIVVALDWIRRRR